MSDDQAEVTLYPPTGPVTRWIRVLANSVARHNDGSLSFKYQCDDRKIRRVTIYGTYHVKYPPDPADNK